MSFFIPNRIRLVFLSLLPIGMALPFTLSAQEVPDRLAEEYLRSVRQGGLIISIVKFDTFSVHAYGEVSRKDKRPPRPDDHFEIGALGQIFSSLLLMVRQEEEALLAHAPIVEYLPPKYQGMDFQSVICTEINMPVLRDGRMEERKIVSCRPDPVGSGECMSFCDLALHSSGLPISLPGGFDWNPFVNLERWEPRFEPVPADTFFNRLGAAKLHFQPGQSFRYSNTGSILLGQLLLGSSELSYPELLAEKVLDPLGLEQTGYFPERLLPGHNYRGREVEATVFEAARPVLGLHSNALDLSRLLLNFITPPDSDWEKMVLTARQDRIEVIFPTAPEETLAGYGWFSTPLYPGKPRRMVWQYGGTAGFRAFVGVVLSTRTGVVILTNQPRELKELGFDLLRAIQPRGRP